MHLNALVINGAGIQRAGFIKMLQDARLAEFFFTEASSLGDALTKIDPLKTDVIFIEWEMSMAVGLDFVHKVRQKQRRHIHIVVITTEGDMAKLEHTPDASSADYFVLRPFTAKTLEQKLMSLTAKLSAASKSAAGRGGAF